MADSKKYNGSTWQHSLRKLTTATDTLTTLPVDIYADGNNATVGLKGNTTQSGTPTPDNPIMPQGTGERTRNLFDKTAITTGKWRSMSGETTVGLGAYSAYIPVEADADYYATNIVSSPSFNSAVAYDSSKTAIEYINLPRNTTSGVLHTPINCAYIIINFLAAKADEIMLNLGSEALPYEPYGQYKIPISSANTTTPVYLGEVETTRKIRKLVLTGNEDWKIDVQAGHQVAFLRLNPIGTESSYNKPHGVCTHYPVEYNNTDGYARIMNDGTLLRIMDDSKAVDLATWTAFLAAQYAAGTPVTVWYVLGTPETGIVNEPLMKIGDYADTVSGITIPTITGKDTFDAQTTLKPSEVSLGYTGWHDATVKEHVSDTSIADLESISISQMENYTIQELQGGE